MKSKFFISLALTFISIVFIFRESYSQMYWNQAASFAGNSSSYVSVPNSASLNITGSFTLEAWIKPSIVTGAKGIISKGGTLGTSLKYCLRMSNGRLLIATNGAQRLITKVSTTIPLNEWTHVAGTYNSSTNLFVIYINGFTDTSATVAAAAPTSNTDSLFIGISGNSTPFSGIIDEVRIWNIPVANIQILAFKNSTMGGSGDFFSNMVLSIPFQNNTGASPFFSAMDHSEKVNTGILRNVSAFDLKDRPSGFHLPYDCIKFSSGGGYLMALDNPSVSPTSKLTLEFWIYPNSDNYGLLYKGSYSSINPDYGMKVSSGKLNAYINNILITSNDSVKKERWSHIAFTYFGATGRYEFYVNGKRGTTGNISPGNINDGPDSLVIGAFPFFTEFTGIIDEFRITCDLKNINDINNQMFTSVNESNDNDGSLNAVYNLDVSTLPNTDGGPRLNLRGNTSFNFNAGFFYDILQSPLNNFSSGQFQSGYYMNMTNKRIPLSGSAGTTKDTIEILSSETINDLNIFVALNHKKNRTLRLTLTNPIGASAEFFANNDLKDSLNNIVTVFDSDADSSLINKRYLSFGPKLKPLLDLDAIFSGNNSKGKWILTITDDAASDTGFVTAWGLQINNNNSLPFNLECTSLVEGFYNSASNLLIADTIRYYLRSSIFPYAIIDSSKAMVNSSGTAIASFTKAQQQENYFLVVKHRNSIETWSSSVINFTQFSKQAQYNFTDLSSKAFGNNMRQVDTSPVKFAIYGGDIDRNGFVDLNDITLAFNDASTFLSGYNITDVNGDNLTDLSDVLIVFNNSSAFVTSVVP